MSTIYRRKFDFEKTKLYGKVLGMRKLTAEEVSNETPKVGAERVRQLARKGFIKGEKAHGMWWFSRSVIAKINARPELRGRYDRNNANGSK